MKSEFLKAALVAVALAAGFWVFAGGMGRTSGEEARKLVEKGAILIDVRTTEEYAQGHIDGAKNIPVQNLDTRMSELPKDKAIVVYCRSGARSSRAMRMLKEKGFTQVYDLGGMSNW
jgi:rhodanese-related sulfurtransferase